MKSDRMIRMTIAGVLMTTTSCATLGPKESSIPPRPELPIYRITQLAFDRDATFAACLEPACPKRTPKTLLRPATAALGPAPVPPLTPTASPGDGMPPTRAVMARSCPTAGECDDKR
jgi:hypothetical protein